MDWFLYYNGLRHERVKLPLDRGMFRTLSNIYDAFFCEAS